MGTNNILSYFNIVEDEFLALAKKLKPHTQRKMKIEPLPWLRDYFVDMSEVYTELNLEQIENKAQGEIFIRLKDYGDVLAKGSGQNSRKKILMKGDPGMGKTTLGKKIGLDWAVGLFQAFSVVFFVALKLVKPQKAIEDVILQQNSELVGLGLSQKKLSTILAKFSDRCLLILDGLDEHGLGKNEDVLKIIRDEKLLKCGIVVFSRPHSAKEIEKYFHTIVSVSGFTAGEAEKFVSKIIKDKARAKEIMKFKPSSMVKSEFPIQKCPILLAFLCALVNDNDIQLSDKTITVGDIYFRMIKHLYKKFVIRKGIDFVEDEFVNVMKSVGKLALKTLTSDNPLLGKGEVHKIVGECAFEYGFLAGHEDSRLSLDVFSDIYVTYTHRSIEEFFGSFGFIQDLCDGKSVEDILGPNCKEPIFMTNPLVLKFCLWFLSNSTLELNGKDKSNDKLAAYVAERIDLKRFHPLFVHGQYQAISILGALNKNDALELGFFRKILEKCQCIRFLLLRSAFSNIKPRDYIDYMLGSVSAHVRENLREITIGDYIPQEEVDSAALSISIGNCNYQDLLSYLGIMLDKYNLARRNPQLNLKVRDHFRDGKYDITAIVSKYVKELQLGGVKDKCTLIAAGEFPSCPTLTHLTLSSFQIDSSASLALKKAVQCGKLPKLRSINLLGCTLWDSNWPEISEFCFQAKRLPGASLAPSLPQRVLKSVSSSNNDTEIKKQLKLFTALKLFETDPGHIKDLIAVLRQGQLSNLRELYMSFSEHKRRPGLFLDTSRELALDMTMSDSFVREFDPSHAPLLEKLTLKRFITSADQLSVLSRKLTRLRLHYLDITEGRSMTGSLSSLFPFRFPILHSLVLRDCGLNSEDFRSLAQSNVQGKLPRLKHLYVSMNEKVDISQSLFSHSVKWNQLLTLSTDDTNVFNIGLDKLCSLRELKIPITSSPTKIARSWGSLQEIDVVEPSSINSGDKILSDIADGVEKGLFPNLKMVWCLSTSSTATCYRFLRAEITVRHK